MIENDGSIVADSEKSYEDSIETAVPEEFFDDFQDEVEQDYGGEEYRLTITMRTAGLAIVSTHLACAISRPLIGVSYTYDDSWASLLSYISWLLYSTIIPGALLLLNHRRGALLNSDVLLIIPISLMWLLAIGPTIQLLGIISGVSNPVQWWTTGYISLILTMFLYMRYSLRTPSEFCLDLRFTVPPKSVLFSCLTMLLVATIGPLLFNATGNNVASMLAIILVATIPTFLDRGGGFGNYLVLYSSALSILLVSSLVSNNVAGIDIQAEYYFSNSVLQLKLIDFFSYGRYSTVLSTQGIVPLLSMWTGIPLTYVLKIIYPMIFSFCTALIYFSYSQLFDEDIAFYSTLMTIFTVSFYTSLLDVVRQGFAEIFMLSAIVLLCSSDDLRMYRNRVFLVPFLISMSLSHYGINYLLYPVFWLAYVFFIVSNGYRPFEYEEELETVFRESGEMDELEDEEQLPVFMFRENILLDEENLLTLEELQNVARRSNPLLNLYHLVTGTVFFLLWHTFAGGGAVIVTVSNITANLVYRIEQFGILGAFSRAQPTQFVTTTLEPLHEITKYWYIFIMILSIPSILQSINETNQKRPMRNFLCLAVGAWAMLAFVFVIPNLAVSLHFPRVFHLMAIFISPFSFNTLVNINRHMDRYNINFDDRVLSVAPRVFLSTLLLLSSGFAYQLTNEGHRMYLDDDVDWAIFSDSEEAGSIWQKNHATDNDEGFYCKSADFYRGKILGKHLPSPISETYTGLIASQYVFISGKNIEDGMFYFSTTNAENEVALTQYVSLADHFSEKSKSASIIYDSGESNWYYFDECKRQ